MLIDFIFKNFSSFSDLTDLSMEADNITEFNNTVIEEGKLKLLPIAAIVGPNESGKSNLISAFRFMKNKITDRSYTKTNPFIFTKEIQDSYFSIKFLISENKIVTYSFILNKNGEVVYESLEIKKENSRRSKRIFTRTNTEINLNNSVKKYEQNLSSFLDKNVLLLSFFKNLKEESIYEIYNWFEEIDIIDFNASKSNLDKDYLKELLDDSHSKQGLLNFLKSIGSSIVDINYDYSSKPVFSTTHIDNDEAITIVLENESKGTLKMISLFFFLFKALKLGLPILIDDLDSQLHPLLSRYIVVNFTNPNLNPNHAQLIFTSHDFSLLNMNLLRRDEIWFIEKDNNISELYSLADFRDRDNERIRKDGNFINYYFLGQFGAVPELQDFSIMNSIDEIVIEKLLTEENLEY